ncbi:DsbA family protein [Lysobacter sp. CA199]|uniref:DsbA family protein n=1 Tax=Lysobacter sp. CA199 TaxID=3455608 RepID=UPI003F8D6B60
MRIELHAGGMMSGANRRRIDPRWREFVLPHDRRIAQVSGQPFGAGYFDGLLRDTAAVLDSTPPIAAVLAAQALARRGLDLLHRLQHAHYAEGRRIAQTSVLLAVAGEIGLPARAMAETMQGFGGGAVERHIEQSRALLSRLGGHGFPTLALRVGEGWRVLDLGAYLGRAEAWRAHLLEAIAGSSPLVASIDPATCAADGCAIV